MSCGVSSRAVAAHTGALQNVRVGDVLSAALLAQALASTPSGPATQPPTQPAPSVVVTHEWYGWQILAVDGAALSLAGIGIAEETVTKQDQALLLTGFVGGALVYALGPPIVHFVHGRDVWGFADFGIRVGSVFVGTTLALAAASASLNNEGKLTDTNADVIVGFFAMGFLVPMIVDAAVLSSATEVRYPDRPATISASWSMAPFVSAVRVLGEGGNRAFAPVFGVGGTF